MEQTMKIMTINTHSLAEPEFEEKREQFARVILKERPDLLAMQEVNQTAAAPELAAERLAGYMACPGNSVAVREDNYAAWLADRLRQDGLEYSWTWLPAKLGYDRYDEGMAVFARRPIRQAEQFFISRSRDYRNWKTRKLLGVQVGESWYYTVHMGWWDDEEEPFASQWNRLEAYLHERRKSGQPVWLMGDFNSPSAVRGQGYDLVCQSGWRDTFADAKERDGGVTVEEVIDGWRERASELINAGEAAGNAGGTARYATGNAGEAAGNAGGTVRNAGEAAEIAGGAAAGQPENGVNGMRLDYIFSSKPMAVIRSQVICNGRFYEKVSDHYGVMIEMMETGEVY